MVPPAAEALHSNFLCYWVFHFYHYFTLGFLQQFCLCCILFAYPELTSSFHSAQCVCAPGVYPCPQWGAWAYLELSFYTFSSRSSSRSSEWGVDFIGLVTVCECRLVFSMLLSFLHGNLCILVEPFFLFKSPFLFQWICVKCLRED